MVHTAKSLAFRALTAHLGIEADFGRHFQHPDLRTIAEAEIGTPSFN